MNGIHSQVASRTASLSLAALVALATMGSLSGCGNMKTEKAEADKPTTEVVAAGTTMLAALQSTVSTGSAKAGDPIELRTVQAVRVNEMDVIPVGSTIHGEVTHAKGAGRVAGGAQLTLRFTTLNTPDGKSYPIDCEPFRVEGKGDAKESALEVAGGAVAGAIVGGAVGGKDDIAKGAAVGAVLGTGVAVATKGDQIVLPAGQKMKVTLTSGVTVTPPKPAPAS